MSALNKQKNAHYQKEFNQILLPNPNSGKQKKMSIADKYIKVYNNCCKYLLNHDTSYIFIISSPSYILTG